MTIPGVDKDTEQLESSHIAWGNAKSYRSSIVW